MKFFKYSLIAALALSGALSACSDDIDYSTGAPVDGDEVYFPLTQSANVGIPNEATSVAITVARLNADDAITVPVASVVTDEDGADAPGIFTVPAQVSFAPGEKAVDLIVGVDFSKVVAEYDYSLTLTLEGDNITPYGASTRTYTLAFSPWSAWKDIPGQKAVYTDSWFEEGEYDVLVKTCHSTIDDTRFKYAVCDANWYFANGDKRKEEGDDPIIDWEYTFDTSKTMEVNGVACPIVTTNYLLSNYTINGYRAIGGDAVSLLQQAFNFTEANAIAFVSRNGGTQSFYNPETGTFYICMMWANVNGSIFSIAYDYLQLPGYKSYVLNFDYTGNYFDAADEIEYAIVNAYKSADVTSYVYDVFAGELEGDDLDAAYDAVAANKELEAVTAGTTNLALTLEEDGTYTLVAVGFDGKEQVIKQAYTFDYKSVRGAAEEWTSLGTCEYTDGVVCSVFNIPALTFDVEIQESIEYAGLYRLVDPYKQLASMFNGAEYLKGKHYITIDAQNPAQVSIPFSAFGLDLGYGEMAVQSLSDYALEYGIPAATVAAKGWFGSLEDEMITFPAGTLIAYDDDGGYDANLDKTNPTLNDKDAYDPFLGEGTFCVDLSVLSAEASAKAKAPVSYKNIAKTEKIAHSSKFVSNFKVNKPAAKTLKTIDAKALKAYREANPIMLAL